MSSDQDFSAFIARLRRFIDVAGARASPPPLQQPSPAEAMGEFPRLALELFALQFEHNEPYRRFCQRRGALPETVTDWALIPAIPTPVFKDLELSCLSEEERTTVFFSSGTTEQRPSRHFHSPKTLEIYEASLLPWFAAHLAPPPPYLTPDTFHLALLTPSASAAPHSSLVHMFEVLRRKCGAPESVFLGRVTADSSWSLDLPAAIESLQRSVQANRPVLLLGTAFSYVQLLDRLMEEERRFQLPTGSRAMETGGYKGRSRALPKAELYALVTDRLGIPADRIVSEYGMSELSSQAYDLATGRGPATGSSSSRRFHFPPWARVQIISPETGRQVGEGETGLIRVFDLANVSSVMAIQTQDLGIRRGEGFELVGRAQFAEPRGCSLTASAIDHR